MNNKYEDSSKLLDWHDEKGPELWLPHAAFNVQQAERRVTHVAVQMDKEAGGY